MTQLSWPITGDPMSNAQWADLAAQFATPGVAASVGGPGLLPYRTAGGLFVPAGEAVTTLGVFYQNTTDVQITVPQNAGGSARNDLLVLRHDLATAPAPALVYVAGGASAPVPTPATDVPLGRCLVPSGSNVPLTVTEARTFTGLRVVPCRAVADIPVALRRFGLVAPESTTGRVRWWNGTAWVNFTHQGEQLMEGFARVYGSGAPVLRNTEFVDTAPLLTVTMRVGQKARVDLSAPVLVDGTTVQTAAPYLRFTGATILHSLDYNERLPAGAQNGATADRLDIILTRSYLIVATATTVTGTFRCIAGSGVPRLVVDRSSAILMSQV